MDKKFTSSLNLGALKHVIIEQPGKSGNKVKGLFIPLEVNNIVSGEKGYYLNVNGVITDTVDDYKNSGYIKLSVKKEVFDGLTDQEKKKLFIGNIRVWDNKPETKTEQKNEEKIDSNDLPW